MLQDLLVTLGKAEEGSRELDAEIAVAVRCLVDHLDNEVPEWADRNFPHWRALPLGSVEVVHTDGTGGLNWLPPYFTTSIDSALTLVPEGWGWSVSDRAPAPHKGRGFVHTKQLVVSPLFRHGEATAATTALALCIAALKARALYSLPNRMSGEEK